MNIQDIVVSHPAFVGSIIGSKGYSIPSDNECFNILSAKGDSEALFARGIELSGGGGSNNVFIIHNDYEKGKFAVDLRGGSNNNFILGPGKGLIGKIAVVKDNCLICLSGYASQGNNHFIHLSMNGHSSGIFIGKGVSSVSSIWILEGDKKSIIIGDDCMISWQVECRNYDSHGIFDAETLEIINLPESIIVGPHCWIGQGAMISRGLTVGAGSIIGARSLVNKDIPSLSAVAGIPAKVIRENVSWSRQWYPPENERRQIVDDLKSLL